MPDNKLNAEHTRITNNDLARMTATDLIESLQGSIESGYMTYPELIGILTYFFKKVIDEVTHNRLTVISFSKKEIGLEKLYNALVELELKEEKK